jgi:hypothetical protein
LLPSYTLPGSIGWRATHGRVNADNMPMIKKLTVTVLVVGVIVAVGLVVHSFYLRTMHTPIPRHSKLIDCTGSVVTCSFTPRKGYTFEMLMAGDYRLRGQVRIERRGAEVAAFNIDSQRGKECNWLQTKGILEAWILTADLHTNYPGLQRYLTAGDEHRITFAFEHPPDTNASIWMTWLEAYKDVRAK